LTRNKVWRLSLAAILGFGWLFLSPASYSDNPLSIADQEITQLKSKVSNLNHKTEFQSLIGVAENKYNTAVSAKTARDNSYAAYDAAVGAEATALSEKLAAQIAVDGQTVTVATALTNKQTKETNLNAAQINYQTALINYPPSGQPGLNAFLYDCWTYWNGYNVSPPFGCDQQPMSMGTWADINFNYVLGGPSGLFDDYQIKWTGYIKQTQHWTPQFRTCGDDGMILKISGITVINNWVDRGGWCGASNGFYMDSNEWVPIEVWWYENGGGANGRLEWNIGNGFTVVPSSALSTEIPAKPQQLIDAENALVVAQSEYDQANQTYNSADSTLTTYNQTLATKTTAHNTAVANTANALTAKNNATTEYNQSIINVEDAIDDAWDYYDEQLVKEINTAIAIALAQAAANQPTVTPTPTPEPKPTPTPTPTPEPSPEQTKPVDPTPTPKPEITEEVKPTPTPEPEPTPEPSPEPSPQPTDTNPDPTPEPEPTPVEPSPKPSQPNVITEATANLIADLTNKNTLTQLSPEQKAEVAQGLGIKTEELSKVVELAASEPTVAKALEEFGDRIKENEAAPMPYTLADATTEIATEAFLADPIGAITNIDFEKILSPSEWGKDMTDDQREKAQEVIVPVIIASNIVAAAMTRRR